MKIDKLAIPGLRRPTDLERGALAAQWRSGTRPQRIRAKQIACVIALALACLALAGSPNAAGIAAIALAVLIFGLMTALLERQLRNIRRFGQLLEQGAFCLAPAVGTGAATFRGFYNYTGCVDTVLPDGRGYNMVKMPYLPAQRLKHNRAVNFPVFLVWLDGEKHPLAFLRSQQP